MKFFKTLKRKAGNAILPVVGTILGLTILAGTVVGVALHSSKIVYKQDVLENQNDARQILYIASKYFCAELNKKRDANTIAKELKGFFGEGLKVTQDSADKEKYYIWYPNKYKTGKEYTTDDNVAEWLKATVKKVESEDEDGDHGNNGINDTLFKEEAKLDEKYSIGNMMTVYMSDEGLLPGRKYSINEVSLVESDIDTFDEAFTYMNNTGVLEIDDIAVALYKLKVLSDANADYIDITGTELDPQNVSSVQKPYAIVYKTGNLGGNYKWQDGDTTTDTWIYRQEYDLDLLVKLCKYYGGDTNSTLGSLTTGNITYTYNEVNDTHKISSTDSTLAKRLKDKDYTTFTSSRKFAEKIADYIFWNNMPLLCMNISEVRNAMYKKMDTALGGYQYDTYDEWIENGGANYTNVYWLIGHDYEWTNAGLNVYQYYRDYRLTDPNGLRWYRTDTYTQDQIATYMKNNFSGKFNTSSKLDPEKIYNAVKAEYETIAINEYKYSQYEKVAINYYLTNKDKITDDFQNKDFKFTNSTSKTKSYYSGEQRVKLYSYRNRQYENDYDSGTYFYNDVDGGRNHYRSWDEWISYYDRHSDAHYNYFYNTNTKMLNPDFYSKGSTKQFDYTVSTPTDYLTEQVLDYLNGIFKQKIEDPGSLQEIISSHITSNTTIFDGFAADSGKMVYQPHFLINGDTVRINYRYSVILKKQVAYSGGTHNYVKKFQYDKEDWDDDVYMPLEEFLNLFAEGIAERYYSCRVSTTEQTQTQTIIEKTEVVENFIKQLMVDPLRYQYLPNSTFDSIVGDNNITGLREQQIANKLLIAYFDKCKADYVSISSDANYKYNFEIISSGYQPYTGEDGMLNYVIKFRLTVDTDGDGEYDDVDVTKEVSFIIGYLTYSPLNNPKLNKSTGVYTEVGNSNVKAYTDSDGSSKNIFSTAPIKNTDSEVVKYDQLVNKTVPAIITCVPYTKRINSNQVPYGDHRITIDGKEYTVTSDLGNYDHYDSSRGYEEYINTNVYYKGDVTYSNYDFYITKGKSLFIDGNLTLKDNADLTLEENAMLFVNGNFRIEYEYTREMQKESTPFSTTWYARQLTNNDIKYFQGNGVDVKADANAKIIVNGNFDYKGVKAKKATSNDFNITIANDPSHTLCDRVYEQGVFNTGFKSGNNCTQNANTGAWTHYQSECRGALEGIYIVNGDIRFLASNEKMTTNKARNQWYAMYSNAYSNPIMNATFYAAGAFNMTGLYTSGMYDKCRANFIFAKSIVEPYIQLNTVLCAENPQYAGWTVNDGYLFVICEEAVEFSKDSFGYVNLFTPFQELVNAINSHKASETNFAQYISKGEFTTMFPNKEIINDWGLPSILKSGFSQMYSPGDIGTLKPEDQFNSAGDTELGNN